MRHPRRRGEGGTPFDSLSTESTTLFQIVAAKGLPERPHGQERDRRRGRPVPDTAGAVALVQVAGLASGPTLRQGSQRRARPHALLHLPHWRLFVEAPCDMRGTGDDVREFQGFFCWYDRKRKEPAEGFAPTEAEEYIDLVFVGPDHVRTVTCFSTEDGCLGDDMERVVTETAEQYRSRYGMDVDVESNGVVVRALLYFACAHLPCIVADNSDQSVVYRPQHGHRPANPHAYETMPLVPLMRFVSLRS